MAYRGPKYPHERHLKSSGGADDLLFMLGVATNVTQGDLWREFENRAYEIDNDADLTATGKMKKRAELVAELRNGRIKNFEGQVSKGRARIQELTRKLTQRPKPENESVYDSVARAHREHRVIKRFERLEPAARREAFRRAVMNRDADLLQPLLAEPALLNEQDAALAQTALMERWNPTLNLELNELAGTPDPSGNRDPLTSAVECASYSLKLLNDELDRWAGSSRELSETRTQLLAQKGDAIVITPEQARNVDIYRVAKQVAAENGKALRIEDPTSKESGDIMPGGGNGSD